MGPVDHSLPGAGAAAKARALRLKGRVSRKAQSTSKKGNPDNQDSPLNLLFWIPTADLAYLDFPNSSASGASNSKNSGFRIPVLQPLLELLPASSKRSSAHWR